MKISQIIQNQKTTANCSDNSQSLVEIKILRKLLEDTICDIVPNFVFDQHNTEIVKNLFLYFTGQKGTYDLNKGIWFMGENGTGKTTLLHVFSELRRRRWNDGFKIYDCSTVAKDYADSGNLDKYLENKKGYLGVPVEMAFDELGREPIPAMHYGLKLNVMQHILHVRYNLWRTLGIQTYVTTNFDPTEVGKLYNGEKDIFISDRIKEMFNVIHLDGDSRRT